MRKKPSGKCARIRMCMVAIIVVYIAAEFTVSPIAGVRVKTAAGEEKFISSVNASGMTCLPISGLAKALGCSVREDSSSMKLTCSMRGFKAIFSEDIPAVCVNDSVCQVFCAPLRRGAALVLPVWICAEVFTAIGGRVVAWNPDDSSFEVQGARSSCATASGAAKRQTGSESGASANNQQVIKTIVVDPGHGGKDPGAIGPDGRQEKDIVLSVGLLLREELKKKSS